MADLNKELKPANGDDDSIAVGVINKLIDAGIDGIGPLESAVSVATKELAKTNDPEKAIENLLKAHTKLVAANGFITGLGGFVTLPVALPVNIVGFYTVVTRLVGAIAYLRGYDLNNQATRSAVLLALVSVDPGGIKNIGGSFSPTGKLADLALAKLPAPAIMVLNKGIGFKLLAELGKKSFGKVLGKGVPIIGGVMGAGMDVWLMRKLAKTAKNEFIRQDNKLVSTPAKQPN